MKAVENNTHSQLFSNFNIDNISVDAPVCQADNGCLMHVITAQGGEKPITAQMIDEVLTRLMQASPEALVA